MAGDSSTPQPTKQTEDGERAKSLGKRRTVGLLPRLVRKFTHSSEALSYSDPTATPKDREAGGEELPGRSPSAPTSPQLAHTGIKDETMRRRRQRRVKRLERQEELRRPKSKLVTTPGERIFPLPSQVRPISLFIRMGSLNSEQDPVPLEYYGVSDEEDNSVPAAPVAEGATLVPHPEALRTRQIFHVGEGFATASPTQSKVHQGRHRTMSPIIPIRSTALPRRPFSIQIPLPTSTVSTLNGDGGDSNGRKRPRSLRFLDPKDQTLYAAISHGDFLTQLGQTEEHALRRSLEVVSITDAVGVPLREPIRRGDGAQLDSRPSDSRQLRSGKEVLATPGNAGGMIPATDGDEGAVRSAASLPKSILSPPLTRPYLSSAPPAPTDSMADTERSNVQDWAASETIGSEEFPSALPLQRTSCFSRPRSMPILPKEHSSLEASDVSGCEADSEERHRIIINRRGGMAGK